MSTRGSLSTFEETCGTVASRLRARLPELEAGLANLIEAISDPRDTADPSYLDSLHDLRSEVLGYAIDVVEVGESRAPGVPPRVLAGARMAAQSGIEVDTLLRRYSAGNALFGDAMIEEAERAGASSSDLRRLLHRQASVFDRLLNAVTQEYAREAKSRPATSAGWRHEYIRGLLAGRQPDSEVELNYDLDSFHLALLGRGDRAHEVIRELAALLERPLLASRDEERRVWACWLGGRAAPDPERALYALEEATPDGVAIAVGEPGEGLAGWRLSHRQAQAALPLAERRRPAVVRYADVAISAAILRDDLAAISMRRLYLEPLESMRDGGETARATLRAYFATERNVSSTAASLGVDRRTVTNRLRAIEDLFGRPLGELATDLEIALRLAD